MVKLSLRFLRAVDFCARRFFSWRADFSEKYRVVGSTNIGFPCWVLFAVGSSVTGVDSDWNDGFGARQIFKKIVDFLETGNCSASVAEEPRACAKAVQRLGKMLAPLPPI